MKGLDRRSKAGPFFGRSVPDAGILSFAVLQRIALCNDMGLIFEASFTVDGTNNSESETASMRAEQ